MNYTTAVEMGKRYKTKGSPTVEVIYSCAEMMYASLLRAAFSAGGRGLEEGGCGGGNTGTQQALLRLSGERGATTAWQPTAQEVNQVQLEAFFWDKSEKHCCHI